MEQNMSPEGNPSTGGSNVGKWIAGVIILALVVWGVAASQKGKNQTENKPLVAGDTIKLGVIAPLTGEEANLGLNEQAAIKIAVNEINSSGGINGKKLEMIYEDGKCNGQDANNAANKLMSIDKVPVILGGLCSGETMAFAQAANNNKTVVFSPCSSSPKVTDAGDYIFRDYPSDNFQGSYAADYVFNKLGKKNVAILYVKSDWGTGVEGVFKDSFKKLGGNITLEEGFDPGTKDSRTLLAKVKNSKTDLVYYVGYTETSVAALQQAKQLGINLPFLGADGWDDAKLWQQAGTSGEGAMYTVVAQSLPADFKAKMKQQIGNDEVIVCSAPAYDATKIIAQIISKVGINPEDIKNELYKTIIIIFIIIIITST